MTRIKELRIQKGYTQEEFRQKYNAKYNRTYTISAISLIENGKRMPEINALLDFADFFDVTIDYLIGKPPVAKSNTSSVYMQKPVEKKSISQKIASIIDSFANNKGVKGIKDAEELELLKISLQLSMALAKRIEEK